MPQSAAPKHEAPRRASYQDVLDAPTHVVAKTIHQTLQFHPKPAMPHAQATSVLAVDWICSNWHGH